MLDFLKMIRELRNEVETLRKEVQTLKDALVKQKRDNNDLFYNLDTDNVPKLNAVVKEIRLISETGITLEGKEIDLNAGKGITITSPNFKVTREGNLVCDFAEIKSGCTLASDIEEGKAMQIGKPYNDDGGNSSTSELATTLDEDNGSLGYARGIVLRSVLQRGPLGNDMKIDGEVVISPRTLELRIRENDFYKESCAVGVRLDETDYPEAYIKCGDTKLWVNQYGVFTTADEIVTGAQ